ncbi:prostaglandin E synthase-like isoform X2 [Nilaparvata lugens]|nr:prostaglandin E synthase-like isoform X2 [Nilaparvata lugens]
MEPSMNDLLSWNNTVFCGLAFYSIILIIQMFILAVYTGITRIKKQAFANPEDAASVGVEVKHNDPDVERVHRVHLNNLENIPAFILSGLFYTASNPNVMIALMLFRIFFVFRILHTVAQLFLHVRMFRSICFFAALFINVFMLIMALMAFHQF